MIRLIPPRYVVEQYLGIDASDWEGRRIAYQLYQNTRVHDLLRMAREMGYTGLDIGINVYPYQEWQRLRGTAVSISGTLY
jgi:signal recognition particle subunit SEC65